ncbi:hypothetical protein TEA_029462 [Camellia sinensis var. sinensis]|uniref:Terpene synthase N-terminal domain-containing protein n=1 Tax=Camellia sinensis var. sinensis TaxID=542762 RepID=A0A4S4DGG9_CAMSN|nr:hypothetical protein TEA_029462 [Camellia sinensis var. sinensis]
MGASNDRRLATVAVSSDRSLNWKINSFYHSFRSQHMYESPTPVNPETVGAMLPKLADVFNKFKDEKGNFKESLIGDMMGMLGLYEATHLLKHGETTLQEAMTFTTTHLSPIAMANDDLLSNTLTPQIIHALKQPIRKGLERLVARHYIPIYEQDGSHNTALLEFAKLDFNQIQSLHKTELSDISR